MKLITNSINSIFLVELATTNIISINMSFLSENFLKYNRYNNLVLMLFDQFCILQQIIFFFRSFKSLQGRKNL